MLCEKARSQLFSFLKSYEGKGYFLSNTICEQKLKTLKFEFYLPSEESVLATIDTTKYETARLGVVFGIYGVYIKNYWIVSPKYERGFVPYGELKYLDIRLINHWADKGVYLDEHCMINTYGIKVDSQFIVKLLKDLQLFLLKELSL